MTNAAIHCRWIDVPTPAPGTPVAFKPLSASSPPLVEHLEPRRLFAGWSIAGRVVDAEPGVVGPIITALPGAVVFADLNGNGIRDVGEPSATSDGNGNYTIVGSGSHTFAVREIPPPGGPHLASGESGSRNVTVADGASITLTDFQDSQTAIISGTLFEDLNGNGAQDAGEPGLGGWTIRSGSEPHLPVALTDTSGHWSMDVPAGSYKVALGGDPTGSLDGWIVTTPAGGVYDVGVTGNNVAGLTFGVRAKGTPGAPSANLIVPAGGFHAALPSLISGGEKSAVRIRIANAGNALPGAPVPITLFASRIEMMGGEQFVHLSASDIQIVSVQEDLRIPPGKSRQVVVQFTFPFSLQYGQYGLVALVGPQNAATGTTTSSNTAGEGAVRFMRRTTFTVGAHAADLAVSAISAPLQLNAARRAVAVVTIQNVGTPLVRGSATLRLFASADQALDAGDLLLGQVGGIMMRLDRLTFGISESDSRPPRNWLPEPTA